MSTENTVDKVKLISELKEIHSELFQVYKKLFDFKYNHDEEFKVFIDNEYKENSIDSKEQKAWNDNFCHRASYTLLNKILFVRICEDKGFMQNAEDYIAGEVKDPHIGEKLSKIGLQKWGRLITNYTLGELIKFAFNDMKQSYSNIVLYKEDKYEILNPRDEETRLKYIDGDKDTKDLVLDFENVLNNIIEKLDTNNFNFKYTDGNILGDVYEKFMDRETRKAIGQFYTPEFVIEYILKNTVEEADVVENPFVTVADISCGSGHFLIMAYDILREKFLKNIEMLKEKYAEDIYTMKKDGKVIQLAGNDYWVKENIHYHILKYCLYGADIDSFAVQLTTINLLLKDLDNFTDELNIIECDSLIIWEKDYDWQGLKEQLQEEFETIITKQVNLLGDEEQVEIKQRKETYSLNFKELGVSHIKNISKEKAEQLIKICEFWNRNFNFIIGNPPYAGKFSDSSKNRIKFDHKEIVEGNFDLYVFFIKRGIDLINNEGQVSFIVPNTWLQNIRKRNLRDNVFNRTNINEIFELAKKVFYDAPDVVPIIYKMTKLLTPNEESSCDIKLLETEKGIYNEEEKLTRYLFKSIGENLWRNTEHKYINLKIDENFLILRKRIESNSVRLDEYFDTYTGNMAGEINKFVVKEKLGEDYYPTLSGRHIERYLIKWENEYLHYCEKLQSRASQEILESEKIIFQGLRKMSMPVRIVSTLDTNCYYVLNTLGMIVKKDSNTNCSLKYLQGILNSRMLNYWFSKTYTDIHIYLHHINSIPIKVASDPEKKIIEEHVEKLLNLKENLLKYFEEKSFLFLKDEKEILDKYINCKLQIDNLELQIDEVEQKLDLDIMRIYGVDEKYYDIFCKEFGEDFGKKYSLSQVEQSLSVSEFINKISSNPLKKIAKEMGYNYSTMILLRKKIIANCDEENLWRFYNLQDLHDDIYAHIGKAVKEVLHLMSKHCSVNILSSEVSKLYYNFAALVKVIRKDNATKKTIDIVKDSINEDCYTWNAYKKDKSQDKISKTFIKYYDSNYYGLAEWSDEIHKQYFMDAIDQYTENSPNEKKAKDILKLFKELNIEDKEDYIDIIEDKIKKAFS